MEYMCGGVIMSLLLKSCPFCGSEVYLEKEELRDYPGCYEYDIHCPNPKCDCSINLRENYTIYVSDKVAMNNAIEAWNRRVEVQS